MDGKWALYGQLQATENEAQRRLLGLDEQTSGVMLRQPYSEDDEYPLKKWDVITHVGDEPIDNKGKVRVRDDLQLLFQYRIPQLAQDGTIPLQIIRDKQPMTVTVPVQRKLDRVIQSLDGAYPRHFIYGPVVFMPASREMIQAAGAKGLGLLLTMESPLLSRIVDKPSEEGEEMIVFRLLTHRSTKGYGAPPYGTVKTINSQPVKNLQDLVIRMRDADGEFIVIEPHGRYETLVFDRAEWPTLPKKC